MRISKTTRIALALALLAVLIFLVGAAISLRDQIVARLVHMTGLLNVTMWAVSLFSTLPERLLLFFLCSVALGASFFFTCSLRSSLMQFLLPVLTSFALFSGLYTVFPMHKKLFPGEHPVAVVLFLTFIVAIDRRRFWLRGDNEEGKKTGRRIAAWLPTVIVVPALAVMLLNGWSLMVLAKRLHADKAVRQFAFWDFGGIAVDAKLGVLFANGVHTNHLLAYDLNALNEPPRVSPVEVAWAEWFEYNPFDQEIYIYNFQAGALLILDATTLVLKKSVAGLNLSGGDVGIVLDRHTDSIVIGAEGDVWPSREPSPTDDRTKTPLAVVDRSSGKLLYRMRWCEGLCNTGNLLIHPRKPILYLGFTNTVVAYDTRARKVVARTRAGYRWMDGVALTPEGDELLVAAPVYSAVLRFDADTLEYKGRIATVFGVRTLEVDVEHKLLLTGSLLTNIVEVIDLSTNARIARYWVAPWLRVIKVDTSGGAAFVSSPEGLFRVDYLARVPSRTKETWDR
jgi:hypothetical protein